MSGQQTIEEMIVDLQTLLEIAKDNWLEDKKEDAVKLLRQAKREIGNVLYQSRLCVKDIESTKE